MGKNIVRILLLALLLMGIGGVMGCDPGDPPCANTDAGCPDPGSTPPPGPGCENTTTGCSGT